ncbi:uncharacterized protein [Ptychodera flava]|uniref:uncharacterized protein n=1 Tax=Ptychodera flava TaxID=63121 RepID=UPI003969E880
MADGSHRYAVTRRILSEYVIAQGLQETVWVSALLLLLSGDVEPNPGPRADRYEGDDWLSTVGTNTSYRDEFLSKLELYRDALLVTLDVDGYILNYLVQEGALDLEEYNQIRAPGSSGMDMVERLLLTVSLKDERDFEVFLTAVHQKHPEMAKLITPSCGRDTLDGSETEAEIALTAKKVRRKKRRKRNRKAKTTPEGKNEDDYQMMRMDDTQNTDVVSSSAQPEKKKSKGLWGLLFGRGPKTDENPFVLEECTAELKELYQRVCSWRCPAPWYAERVQFPGLDFKLYRLIKSPIERERKRMRVKISQSDIFLPLEDSYNPKHLLVYEEPGAYSPVLCLTLAYDWAVGKADCPIKKKIPFLIDGSHPRGNVMATVFDFLSSHLHWNLSKLQALWRHVIRKPQNFVFLVYGMKDKQKRLQRQLTKRICKDKTVKNSYVLLCCELVSKDVRSILIKNCDREILVSNEEQDNMKKHVSRIFPANKEKQEHVTVVISSAPPLNMFCENFINVALVCSLWNETNNIPTKLAEFYQALIVFLARKAAEMSETSLKATELSQLPRDYIECLEKLGECLFVRKGEVRFTKTAIEELLGNFTLMKMGLLRQRPVLAALDKDVEYDLVHESIGDFLVAVYTWSQIQKARSKGGLRRVLTSTLSDNRDTVLRFTVALMGDHDEVLFSFMRYQMSCRVSCFPRCVLLRLYLQCLCDCSDQERYSAEIAPMMPKNLVLVEWTSKEVFGLANVLQNDQCSVVNLKFGIVRGCKWEYDKQANTAFFNALEVNRSVQFLSARVNNTNFNALLRLSQLLGRRRNLRHFQLACTRTIIDDAVKVLCDGFRVSSIESLDLYFLGMNTKRMGLLAETLKCMHRLREFSFALDGDETPQDAMRVLCSYGLQHLKKLERLDLSCCKLGRPHGFPCNSDCIQPLVSLIKTSKNLKTLRLEGCSLSNIEISHLADAIAENRSLTKLDINNNDFDIEGMRSLCTVLQQNPSVKILHTSYSCQRQEKSVSGIGDLLRRSSSLEELHIENRLRSHFCDQADRKFSRALVYSLVDVHDIALALSQNKSLKRVTFGGGVAPWLLCTLVEGLIKNEVLQELEFGRCLLTDKEGMELLGSIYNGQSIRKINLRNNMLTVASIAALSLALVSAKEVEEINLSDNQIKSAGAKALSNRLPDLPQLTRLDLSANGITEEGLSVFREFLPNHPSLRYLNLNQNPIGDEGVISLLSCLTSNEVLEELHLHRCGASAAVLDTLGCLARVNKTLRVIDISPLQTDAGVIDRISCIIESENTSLERVQVGLDLELTNKAEWEQLPFYGTTYVLYVTNRRWETCEEDRGDLESSDQLRWVVTKSSEPCTDAENGGCCDNSSQDDASMFFSVQEKCLPQDNGDADSEPDEDDTGARRQSDAFECDTGTGL